MSRLIYLDNHATTKLDPRVLEAMLPWLEEPYNAGSRHVLGTKAEEAVERARAQVASLINADPREVIFTSGATEANNLAIQGYRQVWTGVRVTTAYEHKSVLELFDPERDTLLRPGPEGLVTPDDVAGVLAQPGRWGGFVSVMWANNEVGTLNDIAGIGAVCRERGVLLHTDAAQAVGKVVVDVKAAGVGMLSLSSHKMHGPQGIGALYVSRSKPRVVLESLLRGGGQERGLRSGTLPVALIVGFGEACALADAEMERQAEVAQLRDQLLFLLRGWLPAVRVNGSMNRLPGNLNISIPGVYGPDLVKAVADKVAISNGSACNTGSVEPSHVLLAMGLHPQRAHEAVRFGLSKFTTVSEVEAAAALVAEAAMALGPSDGVDA